jgi:Zn-dependent peptidase ImmA (M78 family)
MTSTVKKEAAEAAARTLAETWGDRVPVDPARIARGYGIAVREVYLDSDVSGALVKETGRDPAILLNAEDSANRQRFTCAHELGHFVRRSDQPDAYQYVDLRGNLAGKGSDSEEIFANEFAAALLMPEAAVRQMHKQHRTDLDMARRFGVSREAAHYRLVNLGLLG